MATALITGGTSGIGNTFAHHMAARGDNLVLVARDTARLELVADELHTAHGVTVEVITADLSVREDVLRVAGRLEDPARPVDILVNNAGFGLHSSLLENLELHERALDVMCLAVLILGGAAGRAMRQRGRGQIINVSSTSAVTVSTNRGEYCISKAGMAMSTQLWAARLAPEGIVVYEIRPGIIATDMTAGVTEKYDRLIAGGILVQPRWGEPGDVGKAVAMLARGDLPYSTGQVVMVDGGLTIPRL